MNTLEAIAARRSIRTFIDRSVSEEDLETILNAAIQAPSANNRQPWKFVVVREDRRAEMLKVMRRGLATRVERGEDIGSSERTASAMEEASVTVMVFNPEGLHPAEPRDVQQVRRDVGDNESIGAAIQNMLLAAQDLGIGSLWIGHVFNAYEELCGWLDEKGQLIAAVSFGYAGESPKARPRKSFEEVVRWL